jgi:hypothetical protein
VVTGYDKNGNAGGFQTVDLGDEIEAGMVVFPVAVEQVSRNQDEIHGFRDSQVDEIFERPSGGLTDFRHRRTFVSFQAVKGTVQMDIGGMDEFKHGADDPFMMKPQ